MSLVDFLWLWIFVPLIFLSVGVSRRVFHHWFTPLSVFIGVNSISLSLYHLRLLEMTDVSAVTHAVILSSFGMFFLGVLLAAKPIEVSALKGDRARIDGRHLSSFFYMTAVLAAIGWMVQLSMFVMTHGVGALLGNIWMLQDKFQMQFIGYLNLIGILVLPAYVLKRVMGTARKVDILIVLATVFGLVLTGVKGYLIYSVFAALFTWSVARPSGFRMIHLAGGMFVMLGFFIVYSAKIDIFSVDFYGGSQTLGKLAVLKRPYLYFVGSWPALEFIVNGTVNDLPRFGFVVLEPIWKLLGGLGLTEIIVKAHRQYVVIGKTTFNVFSLIGEVYWDVKWPGLLVVSWLLG
ncbi:MAG: hypothetical protein KAH56_14290, partial [Candidatus Krumholzibacteria bacterium]|nr:hypothetical protein [Candidatus Krumholzibacteria bacterium]